MWQSLGYRTSRSSLSMPGVMDVPVDHNATTAVGGVPMRNLTPKEKRGSLKYCVL